MNWKFEKNLNGYVEGISDAGIETFLSDPFAGLAREICQNSIDARLENNDTIRVEFETFDLDRKVFPGHSDLEEIFANGEKTWSSLTDRKALDFFSKGKQVLRSKSIKCLRISDFNTTGLIGVREKFNSPWINLTKSAGVSDKGASSGGSFGIGKNATFACSNLRTVFYNTVNSQGEFAFQGVSKLAMFEDLDGKIFKPIGYLGNDFDPIFENRSLQNEFSRNQNDTGTDIFILGIKESNLKEFNSILVNSVLAGFMYAIFSGELEVLINGIVINKETLKEVVKTFENDLDRNVLATFNVLISHQTKWKSLEFKKMGSIIVGILLDQEGSNNVCMVRETGMKIFDKKFQGLVKFDGLAVFQGKQLNSFLRSLENPQHTEWKYTRAENRNIAKSNLQIIYSNIRDFIHSLIVNQDEEFIQVSVQGILSNSINGEDINESQGLPNKIVNVTSRKIIAKDKSSPSNSKMTGRITRNDPTSPDLAIEEKKVYNARKESDAPSKSTTDKVDSEITLASFEYKPVDNVVLTSLCLDREGGQYVLIVKPESSWKTLKLDLKLVGEFDNVKAPIISVVNSDENAIDFINSEIYLHDIFSHTEVNLFLKFDYDEYCVLEVDVYGKN